MITVYIYKDGETKKVDRVEPSWLEPASGATLWVDVVQPTPEEGQQLLGDTFHFHPLSIEDALSDIHHPKVEPYERYLYVILHGIDFQASEHQFATRDVDFFLGDNYLVTVHDGHSRSIQKIKDLPAADGVDRHVGDERTAADLSRQRARAVLVDRRHHARDQRRDAAAVSAEEMDLAVR